MNIWVLLLKKKTTHEKQGIYGGDEDWFMQIEYW